MLGVPPGALLHRQPDAQPPGRALLHPTKSRGANGIGRRPDQNLPAAWDQGLAAVFPRRSASDPRRRGRVLQSRARNPTFEAGEGRPRGVPPMSLGLGPNAARWLLAAAAIATPQYLSACAAAPADRYVALRSDKYS